MKEKILKALIEGESVALKYKDVKKYANMKTGHEMIFLGHVNPAKEIAAEILSELSETPKTEIYNKHTTNEIIEKIKKNVKNKRVLILFNDFQELSKSTVNVFINIIDHVQFFCSIRGKLRKNQGQLLKKMIIISDPTDEITDIKVPIIIFAGTLAFLVYLKVAMSLQGLMAYLVLASVWFGTIMARTLLWIAR